MICHRIPPINTHRPFPTIFRRTITIHRPFPTTARPGNLRGFPRHPKFPPLPSPQPFPHDESLRPFPRDECIPCRPILLDPPSRPQRFPRRDVQPVCPHGDLRGFRRGVLPPSRPGGPHRRQALVRPTLRPLRRPKRCRNQEEEEAAIHPSPEEAIQFPSPEAVIHPSPEEAIQFPSREVRMSPIRRAPRAGQVHPLPQRRRRPLAKCPP